MKFSEQDKRRQHTIAVLIKAAHAIVNSQEGADTLLYLGIAVVHVTQLIGEEKTKEALDVARQIHESR